MTPADIRRELRETDLSCGHDKLILSLVDLWEATEAHIFAPSAELKTHQHIYLKLRAVLAKLSEIAS